MMRPSELGVLFSCVHIDRIASTIWAYGFVLSFSDTDGVGGSARDLSEKKMGKTVQPINTTTYTVSSKR